MDVRSISGSPGTPQHAGLPPDPVENRRGKFPDWWRLFRRPEKPSISKMRYPADRPGCPGPVMSDRCA